MSFTTLSHHIQNTVPWGRRAIKSEYCLNNSFRTNTTSNAIHPRHSLSFIHSSQPSVGNCRYCKSLIGKSWETRACIEFFLRVGLSLQYVIQFDIFHRRQILDWVFSFHCFLYVCMAGWIRRSPNNNKPWNYWKRWLGTRKHHNPKHCRYSSSVRWHGVYW